MAFKPIISYKKSGERFLRLIDDCYLYRLSLKKQWSIICDCFQYNHLAMQRKLNQSIECIMDPMYADLPEPIEPTIFTYERIDVSSPWVDVESLQKMFNENNESRKKVVQKLATKQKRNPDPVEK